MAETGVRLVNPGSVVARTSLIIGDQRSEHVRAVHELVAGARTGVLFTDDIRCPVHVADLAAAPLELASSDRSSVHHLAGTDPVSRHELGTLIALGFRSKHLLDTRSELACSATAPPSSQAAVCPTPRTLSIGTSRTVAAAASN